MPGAGERPGTPDPGRRAACPRAPAAAARSTSSATASPASSPAAPAPAPRADPARGELPFMVEHTAAGPLYVRRVRALPGREGRPRPPGRRP